eukprot:191666_1
MMLQNTKYSTVHESTNPRNIWRNLSELKCPCSICALQCCSSFVSLLWIVFGVIGAFFACIRLSSLERYATEPCCSSTWLRQCWDQCCVSIDMQVHDVECESIETFLTVSLVEGALRSVAGVCGIIGSVCFITVPLLIQFCYSLVTVVLSVVTMSLYIEWGISNDFVCPISIVLSCFIACLFYMNWRFIKDTKTAPLA